ncbi:MAG: GntR family transcriptional regulator [Leucobacter sp.]
MSFAPTQTPVPGLRVGSAMATAVSRKDAVRIEIRRSIILGSLRPGDKLTEAQLAERLGVSRPTIREALNALAEEGLVTKEAYRGMRVAQLEPEAIHDIAIGRIALDMVAVDAILADRSDARFEIIERGWLRYEIEAFDPDPVAQHDAHLEFHRCIWEASGNYLLEKLWPVTAAQLTIALAEDQRHRADPEREHRVHLTLMEALRTRDREVIRQAVSAHTLTSADELVSMMLRERAEQA